MKTVLVFGGTGFLGRNLVPMLKATTKYNILSVGKMGDFNMLDLDVLLSSLSTVCPDIIINLAAHVGSVHYVMDNEATIIDDNSRMYLNLYRAISETCPNAQVINALANCSYPGEIDFYTEKSWWKGRLHPSVQSFGTSKLLLWMLGECYRSQYDIKSVSVIFPNAYGINDGTDVTRMHAMNAIIARMIKAKRNRDKTFTIWGTGSPVREWIYMPDAARILMGCIDREFEDSYFNAAQKQGISITDTTNLIAKEMSYDVELKYDTSKPDGAPVKIMDDELFRKYFPGFQFMPYETGIKNTIKYFETILE